MEDYKNFIKDWNYSNPKESRKAFQRHLENAKENHDSEFEFLIKTQIARTFSLELKFNEAHSLLDEIEKQLSFIQSGKLETRYYLERGRSYNSSKILDKAKECFKNAIEVAKLNKEEYLEVDALHMMGIAEEDPLKQIEWNEMAIKVVEDSKSEDTQHWLGPLLNNTGWSVFDLKDYSKALHLFEKSLEFRQKEGKPEKIAIAMWCIARTYRALNDLDRSLSLQQEVQSYRKEKNLPKGGFNYEEFGEIYLLKNMPKEAEVNFKEAYSLLSQDKWLVANEPKRLERIKQLAKI